jgi:uncharacterized protein (TIGR02246 family)
MFRPYSGFVADPRLLVDIDSQIRNLSQDFVTAFNTGNYDQAAEMFTPDGVLMLPRHETAYGKKSIELLLRQFAESGYENLRLETTRVEQSSDMAMETGRYTLAVRQANGTKIVDRGKYLKVWRRLGAWLIVANCCSSNLPLDAARELLIVERRSEAS